jgi:inner membrane protein YidH
MKNDSEIRDKLALERTRLANERTFLAYIRTGLSLLAASAVLFQFFSSLNAYVTVAWLLAGCGIVVLSIGLIRFNKVRRKLKNDA